ncbi:flagellar biosynthesis protein FlhB [Halanaerobacter jeridensis]|uniref:Flagellar biosynthetic protein FlhB n=1 Tax=Halanaerobacter jeridensis TaxID=706427 RepID=A0A938XS98_9FIRM|nr:flagellar biosynthesis protein FlhB [Halanaerobacter jeridensis]MBM7555356.1 flagellar biosynthetic protein FlhB [Halanaerobacter jeridensis]
MPDDAEKTEDPTPKRREEAREEGQVAESQELNTALTLFFSFVILFFVMPHILKEIMRFITKVYTQYFSMEFSLLTIHNLSIEIMRFILRLIAPIFTMVMVVGVLSSILQIGFLFSPQIVQPEFSKLNPIQGVKQMFSKKTLVELVKSVAKIVLVVGIAFVTIRAVVSEFLLLIYSNLEKVISLLGGLSFKLGMRVSLLFLVLGIMDLFYQRWQHEQDLKMSKKEVEEERKQTEGNPEVKQQRKQKQQEMAQQRMMQDVPDADVVITNPTHFAIAIKFDIEAMEAPVVLAKGQDDIAQKIKEVAQENEIEIVEEKPLARALYRMVEIGEEIPAELYQAVAEILAYVYQMDDERRL